MSMIQKLLDPVAKLEKNERELKLLEEEVAELKRAIRIAKEEDIPSTMAELGISDITLSDGTRVSLRHVVRCGITDVHRAKATKWLHDHHMGDMIKNTLIVESPTPDEANTVMEIAGENRVTVRGVVHPSTLRAAITRLIEDGYDVPHDLFSVQTFDEAVIHQPKEKSA